MNVNRPLYVLLFTAAITAVFTAAVLTVQEVAAEKIRRNEALRYEKALLEVFGLAEAEALTDQQAAEIVKSRIERGQTLRDPETARVFEVIRAYGRDEKSGRARTDSDLLGLAFGISGRGFWAPISGLMALTPDLNKVIGVVFLDHKETPGLGGRISEQWFEKQFVGINVEPPRKGDKFIYIVKERPRDPSDPRYDRAVDAITGATQTSMAVEKFINANLGQFRRAMQAGSIVPAKRMSQ